MRVLAAIALVPFVGVLAKPPPAWVTTASGRHPLGYSSYCWRSKSAGVCADYVAPRCGDGHTPTVRIRSGETVRFELGFRPSSLSISSRGHTRSLPATQRPRFRVDRAGVTSLFADTAQNGDASYTACFVFGR